MWIAKSRVKEFGERIERLRTKLKEAESGRIAELNRRLEVAAGFEKQISELTRRHEALNMLAESLQRFEGAAELIERIERSHLLPEEVVFALGRIDLEDPGFMALIKTIEAQVEVELGFALKPGQSNEDRQFAAGRAAAAADLLHVLGGAVVQARRVKEEKAKG